MLFQKKIFTLLSLLISCVIFGQEGASSCAELEANFQQYQSCATNIPFRNSTNNTSDVFNTTCIGDSFRGPTWFYMRIQQSGDIRLQISQVDDFGNSSDVDFVLWGPFDDLNNICSRLNINTEVDCSWSSSGIENVNIPAAVSGKLYVLLVDNYANTPGEISIRQTGGTGSSDCSFLSSVEILDEIGNEITQFNYCQPQNKTLLANIDTNNYEGNLADLRFNYKWFFNDILVADIQNSTINTNTFIANQTGNYRVEVTAYDSTDSSVVIADLEVSTDEIDLIFYGTPTLISNLTLQKCDNTSPYNGLERTNLTEIESTISLGGDYPVLFKYWLDAAHTQEITDATNFLNTTPSQTIYVTASYDFSCTSNIASSSFELIINTLPASDTNPQAIEKCDETGFSSFDLRIRENQMASPASVTSINFKYYIDRNDALSNAGNFIATPDNYTNTIADTQTIYVRLAEATDPDNSCFRILELQLIVNNIPPNNISTTPYTSCVSGGIGLFPAEINTGLSATDFTFEWFNQHNALPGNSITTETGSNFTTTNAGNYSVKIVDTTNPAACERIINFSVISSIIPSGNNNPQPIYLCDNSGFANFNLRIREAEMAETLNVTDLDFKYYKNETDALNNAGNFIPDPENHINSTSNEDTIYVRIADAANPNSTCFVVVQLDLFVEKVPENNLRDYPYRICMSMAGQPLQPAIIDTNLDPSVYTFSWHRGFNALPGTVIVGENDAVFETTVGGNYSVKIINTSNPAMCETIANFEVLTADIPFNIEATPVQQVSFAGNATITVTIDNPSPDFQFMIDNNGWQESPVFENILPGFHTVSVRNKFGCETTSTQIVVVDYMKVFTPNGDGYNDFWTVGGRAIFEKHQLFIFDRYGKLIADITRNLRGWDGTFNGKPLPADDYWFKIIYERNGEKGEYRNHFTLKR
ncbi:T9SS type B sorting domain-containing protein [Flavobacterium sp. NST-5]|uniref:T9SS type B sorting domain-containing protein n=1 Tax=Flavobacterium ichthyis TaxID=2698827 RepID=A0ABW9Z483_9FLAO|nr:T9SS type B sorting domain-containing protein [Flavobacterium ichthyis]NBL63647.1 T9SS type B sorting domain-containing protein [Flavobacterium ichthyis]